MPLGEPVGEGDEHSGRRGADEDTFDTKELRQICSIKEHLDYSQQNMVRVRAETGHLHTKTRQQVQSGLQKCE